MGQHGTAWDSMGQHGTAWDSMGQHGTAWAVWDSMGQWDSMGSMGSMGQHGTTLIDVPPTDACCTRRSIRSKRCRTLGQRGRLDIRLKEIHC